MSLFKEIVNESELLTEINAQNDSRIKDAINKVLRVRIVYNDNKDYIEPKRGGKKTRYILPVAYGLTHSGKKAVRAYQTAGSTKRGAPKWKLFLLDNIISWTNGSRSFKKYGDSLIRLGLNTNGDKHMTTLYAITPIGGGGSVPIAKSSEPIDSEPITKIDVEPTTKIVQNPNIVKQTKDFVPTIKNTTSIDNKQKNNYVVNKSNTPETEPIKKVDIVPDTNIDNNTIEPNQMAQTKPITKNDIDSTSGANINNKLSNSFNDLMNRMDNINKEDEEEENKN